MTEDELEEFARAQIAYEVRTLMGQVEAAHQLQRNKDDPVYMALVEASLVHLRLLDDFLQKPPEGDDVSAEHYLPGRTRRGFLPAKVRRRINGQVQHLAGRRAIGSDWDLAELARSFARCFLQFALELAENEDLWERSYWFEESSEWCLGVIDSSEWDRYEGVLHGS